MVSVFVKEEKPPSYKSKYKFNNNFQHLKKAVWLRFTLINIKFIPILHLNFLSMPIFHLFFLLSICNLAKLFYFYFCHYHSSCDFSKLLLSRFSVLLIVIFAHKTTVTFHDETCQFHIYRKPIRKLHIQS